MELKNLGVANGWSKTPKIVEVCRELDHKTTTIKEGGRGRNTVKCEKCGYFYAIDSS